MRVTKYTASGLADPTFGDEGTVVLDGGVQYEGMAVGADGSTFIASGGHVLKLGGDRGTRRHVLG